MALCINGDYRTRCLKPENIEDEIVLAAWDSYLSRGGVPTMEGLAGKGGNWHFTATEEGLTLSVGREESPAAEAGMPATFTLEDLPEPEGEFPHICGGPGRRLLAIAGNSAFCDEHGATLVYPVDGKDYHCGFFPRIALENPYIAGALGVTEAIAGLIARGHRFEDITLAPMFCAALTQEGEEPIPEKEWLGHNVAAALGMRQALTAYGLPEDPGAFALADRLPQPVAITLSSAPKKAECPRGFTAAGNKVCLFAVPYGMDGLPMTAMAKRVWERVVGLIAEGTVLSAAAMGAGGLAQALGELCLPKDVGFALSGEMDIFEIGRQNYGAILVEAKEPIPGTVLVGETLSEPVIRMNKCQDTPLSLLRVGSGISHK